MANESPQLLAETPMVSSLRDLSELDEAKFNALHSEISSAKGFQRDPQRCRELADKLQYEDASQAMLLLGSLGILYRRYKDWGAQGKNADENLKSYLQTTSLWRSLRTEPEKFFSRLSQLLERNLFFEKAEKLEWLRTGILEQAVRFASFVDLRPDFSEDRSEISRLIPVVIFQIIAISDTGDEKAYVVQLSENGVRQLEKATRDIVKKLNVVKSDSRLVGFPLESEGIGEESGDSGEK